MLTNELESIIQAGLDQQLETQALVIADIQDYLQKQHTDTKFFAIASLCATAKLHSIGRGIRLLLKAKEYEAASPLLRPAFETAASSTFLHRIEERDRELYSKRFLIMPSVKGRINYLRAYIESGQEAKANLRAGLRAMEHMRDELQQGPGRFDSWHGLGGVVRLMKAAGLDEVNCRYVELLHADVHSPIALQFLSMGKDGLEFIPKGTGSRMLGGILLYGVLWCGGFVQSILIQESTQIRTLQTLNVLATLQKRVDLLALHELEAEMSI
jgi:hypothetical protein